MIPKKEAEDILESIKNNKNKKIPVILHLSEMTSISAFSLKKTTNRIHIAQYRDRYASKRTFYKAISLQHPRYK
ncbi:hypothetical protein ACFSTE_08200 [Aquimarina hainanensis]|uniref:Uncharacterized protein n=1 Tax=Aquimarina hainanensis TaxID=1578017 RepID=A0ABW5N5A1_9FLAO|nr:hypothetical protein [Aquimarina sp. TRL1]QKX04217.1 hypothetical protein HN014_04595 [Aquimarina sp. TRL1]